MTSSFYRRIENEIDEKLPTFERMNTNKPHGFLVRTQAAAFRWPIATVSCPPGTVMLSGGGNCKSLNAIGWVFLYESRPISENQYRVSCDTPKRQNVMAEAFVVCE